MMMTVKPIRTTGQYMYMELIHEKLSHMNKPIKKMKKDGISMQVSMQILPVVRTCTYLEQFTPL